jgi:hypothetical protein
MARADDRFPRARRDAARELCGIDLILECECAASRRNPRDRDSKTMEQDGLAPLPLHGSPRTEPVGLGADLQTIGPHPQKPADHSWTAGFFIAEATTTNLAADLVLWNVVAIAEQPRLGARIEIVLN